MNADRREILSYVAGIAGAVLALLLLANSIRDYLFVSRLLTVQQVRRELVLDAVVESNHLQATEKDMDERITALAAGRNMPTGQLYAQLEKAGRLRELERSLTEDKAFAWLLQQSTVVDA